MRKELDQNQKKYSDMEKAGTDAATLKKFKEQGIDDNQKVVDEQGPKVLKAYTDLNELMQSYEEPSGGIKDQGALNALKETEEWKTAVEQIQEYLKANAEGKNTPNDNKNKRTENVRTK